MPEGITLSDLLEFKSDIEQIVKDCVKEELKKYKPGSGLTEEQAKDLSHGLGMLSDLGGGDASKGIEVIRDNNIWLQKQRERGEKIASRVIFVMVTSLIASGLYALWEGFKSKILGMFGT